MGNLSYTLFLLFVTPTDFDAYNKTVNNSIRSISEIAVNKFKNRIIPKDSVIVTCIGSQMGKVAINKKACLTNQQINSIIPNKEFDSDFIYYTLKSMQDYLRNLATGGSTMPIINKSSFENITITVPPLPTQTAIASILSSLDQKIELNNAINRNLEALAQALFKQWFVEFEFPVDQNGNFSPLTGEMSEGQRGYKSSGGEMVESELGMIPKGWRVGSIYEASDVIYGAPFKSSLFNQEKKGYPLIRIRDLKTYAPQFWTEENHPKGVIIRAGELVVGMDAEFRPHIWLGEEAYLNQRLCHFKPKGYFTRLFVCETIRPQLMFHENSSVGTTVIHLGKKEIDSFKTLIPPNNIIQSFGETTEPILEQIVNNSKENRNLKSLRDTLLPKLISGELEVKDV